MEPIVQEESTGGGIAASVALAGICYAEAKRRANAIGVYAEAPALMAGTESTRGLLREFGIALSPETFPSQEVNGGHRVTRCNRA